VDESIRITRAALQEYRRLRTSGDVEDMSHNEDVRHREAVLTAEAQNVLDAIDRSIPQVCTPEGLYTAFAAGFMPVPDLWHCREEFPEAVRRQTAIVDGSVQVVDSEGRPVPAASRAEEAAEVARRMRTFEAPAA